MTITDSVAHPVLAPTVTLPSAAALERSAFPMGWTMADLRERLGGIRLERIHLYPWPGLATEQDVLSIRARTGRLCELIDGVLVEKPMGFYESVLAVAISDALRSYLKTRPLGIVAGEAGMLRISGRQIRIPDVSFIRWQRLPQGRDPIPAVSPDLAVEVLSESNTEAEIRNKLQEYFAGGTQLAWIIDLPSRSARIYPAPDQYRMVDETGSLDGANVLPGFQLHLRDLFAELDRPDQSK